MLWKASRPKITDTTAGQEEWHSCFRGQLTSGQNNFSAKFHSKLKRMRLNDGIIMMNSEKKLGFNKSLPDRAKMVKMAHDSRGYQHY